MSTIDKGYTTQVQLKKANNFHSLIFSNTMQNRIETLRAEIAQRQSELKKLENDQQAERDEIMDIIKSVTR